MYKSVSVEIFKLSLAFSNHDCKPITFRQVNRLNERPVCHRRSKASLFASVFATVS